MRIDFRNKICYLSFPKTLKGEEWTIKFELNEDNYDLIPDLSTILPNLKIIQETRN